MALWHRKIASSSPSLYQAPVLAITMQSVPSTAAKLASILASHSSLGKIDLFCGKYFSDADGADVIAKDSWVIPAKGHTFSETWTYDDAVHYHAATCEHKGERADEGEHTFSDGVCTVCGAEDPDHVAPEKDAASIPATGDVPTFFSAASALAGATAVASGAALRRRR